MSCLAFAILTRRVTTHKCDQSRIDAEGDIAALMIAWSASFTFLQMQQDWPQPKN
jgi:hypothetical protein